MDASVAAVCLSLSEDLIGLLLGLWAYFREIQGTVPIRSRTVNSINSTSYLPLLDHRLSAVVNQVLKLVS